MKKLIIVFVIITLTVCATTIASAAVNKINVAIDDRPAAVPDGGPYLNSDYRTMIPIGFLSESLGCEVETDENGSATIKKGDIVIDLYTGDYYAWVTDMSTGAARRMVFDTKFVAKDGVIMVPIRFISDMLGDGVEWKNSLNQVNIQSSGPQQPGYYNRMFSNRAVETLPYKPEDPFEIEYDGITKDETDYDPILGELSLLPNCTYVSKMRSVTSGQLQFRFIYKEINTENHNILNTVYSITLDSDLDGMSFRLEKNNALALGLLRNTLAILYGGDTEGQDAIYRKILEQRTAVKSYNNKALLKKYALALDRANASAWKEDGVKVWGTVQKIK